MMKRPAILLALTILAGCATFQPPDCLDLCKAKNAEIRAVCSSTWILCIKPDYETKGHAVLGYKYRGQVNYWSPGEGTLRSKPRFVKMIIPGEWIDEF